MDFGDLLLHMTELMRDRADILAQYHRMFRYILVDKYRDTNLVLYLWLRLLAQAHKSICCAGDDDQSIYSWRGAEVDNILTSYGSSAPILAATSALIAHNAGRRGKTLAPVGRTHQVTA